MPLHSAGNHAVQFVTEGVVDLFGHRVDGREVRGGFALQCRLSHQGFEEIGLTVSAATVEDVVSGCFVEYLLLGGMGGMEAEASCRIAYARRCAVSRRWRVEAPRQHRTEAA